MPRSNFIENPGTPGEGHCRVCDYAYSRNLPEAEKEHRKYHKRYLHACDEGTAPASTQHRETEKAEGLRMQSSDSLSDRKRGARRWFEAYYHDHLARALLYEFEPMSRSEFFTKHVEDRDRLRGKFDEAVAYELRFVFSTHPMYDSPPPAPGPAAFERRASRP